MKYILTRYLRGETVELEQTTVARQWLDKHVSATMDTHVTNNRTVGIGIFYAFRGEAITHILQ